MTFPCPTTLCGCPRTDAGVTADPHAFNATDVWPTPFYPLSLPSSYTTPPAWRFGFFFCIFLGDKLRLAFSFFSGSKEANAKQSHDFRFIGAVAMLLSTGWLYLHYGVKANVAEMTGNSPGGRRDEFYQGDAAEIRKLREELHTANKHIEGLERAVNLKPIDPQLASDNEQAVLRELTPKTTTHQPPAVSFHQQADPISSSLDRIAAKAINDTIVLSFCSIKYLQPMANWLAALNKHGIKNWGIVCLDQPMRKWLQEHNTECAYFLKGWKHGVYDPEESNVVCDKPGEHEAMSLSKCKAGCVNDVDCAAITYVQANKSCARCPVCFSLTHSYHRKSSTGKLPTDHHHWVRIASQENHHHPLVCRSISMQLFGLQPNSGLPAGSCLYVFLTWASV